MESFANLPAAAVIRTRLPEERFNQTKLKYLDLNCVDNPITFLGEAATTDQRQPRLRFIERGGFVGEMATG